MKLSVYGGPGDGAEVVIPEDLVYHGFIISLPVKMPDEWQLPYGSMGHVPNPTPTMVAYTVVRERGKSPLLVFLPIARNI